MNSNFQSLQAHSSAITAVSFNEDGKYLVTYSAQEGKIAFFQTSQTFLGMGQSQMKLLKTQPGWFGNEIERTNGKILEVDIHLP